MDSDILALYLRQSEETKSKFSADDYKDIVDCFSSVIIENNYYKTYLAILKNKKGNSKKEETEYNEQCKILYDKLVIDVFDCMKETNPNRNADHLFDNEDKYLKQIWFSFISSAAIDKKSLLSSRYSESTKFINMIKKQVDLETEHKVQDHKYASQQDMSQRDLIYYSPIKEERGPRSSPQLYGKTPLKSNHISSEVTTFVTNFKEAYDDISSLAYMSIEDILLSGKPWEGSFIQSTKSANEMLDTFKDLLSKNRMSLEDMASKRKSFFQSDFMKKMLETVNLIMTQSDLMHDIILKKLLGVWDQCDYIYKTLRLELNKLPDDSNKSMYLEYLQKIDEFKSQLDACWSQGGEEKAIQEKIRFLRQNITNWLIEIVKLPKQDFEKQVFTREESIIYCLNFYGDHKASNFVFRESGRPVLDFIKIKKLTEDFDEAKKKDFMSKLTKEGKELLDFILYSNKVEIEKLEKRFISEPNTLSVIDGCLKKDFETILKEHTFKTMFGIYEYTVISNIKKNQIDAASVGHLIVIRNAQLGGEIVAIYGLVGPVTVNNVLDTYYKLGGQVTSGAVAGRGKQKGNTNLFQGNIQMFSNLYDIDISNILPEIENNALKQKTLDYCNYFRINMAAFDDNEIYLLTLGIKTICDEVLDVNGDNVKLVITVDSLVWDTILKKWLTGDKIVLPYVFRSFSRSYIMNSGKLEANVEFISKEIFVKILKYCQLAKSLAYINIDHIRMAPIDTINSLSDTLIDFTDQFLTSLGSSSTLNKNFTVNRYVNAIYRIIKLLLMPIQESGTNNAYDNCSGFIIKLNASNVYENLLINITKMSDFLYSFVNSPRSQLDIELFVDNINSLAGDQNLLRITEVNQYHESQTTSYPNDLIDAVGTNYGVLIKIADVTETSVTFYTGGETVDLKKALKSTEIDFDVDNVDIPCEKMYNGRQTVDTTGKPITFHIVEYTYSIEFLIKILENSNGFDIDPVILEKIQYFCIKYFVNNYEMVKQNALNDETFLNLLKSKFGLNRFTDTNEYLAMKRKLEEAETQLPENKDDVCDYGGGVKPKNICPDDFNQWVDDQLKIIFIPETFYEQPLLEIPEDSTDDDPIQQSINRVSRLIMTNCGTTGEQISQKKIDSKEKFDDSDDEYGIPSPAKGYESPIQRYGFERYGFESPTSGFGFETSVLKTPTSVSENPANADFNAQLLQYGLVSIDMPSDGNCFFHAVVDQLTKINGNQNLTIKKLRDFTTDYLIENHKTVAPFLIDETPDQYIYRMSRDGEWADHLFIHALCQAFGINILIINNQHVNDPSVWAFISSEQPNSPTITVGQLGEVHYTSIVSTTVDGVAFLDEIIQMNFDDYSPDQVRQTHLPRTKKERDVTSLQDDNEKKRAKTPEITKIKRATESSQGFLTPTKKGGKSSTRGRQSKVKRFTKGRNRKQLNKHKIIRKTKKIYRKKYKTRRH
jgi:hypothetical protein